MKDANDATTTTPASQAFNDPTAHLNMQDVKILTESMDRPRHAQRD
jgi:hypothetical protein